jgi:hypothetical protein
MPAGQLVSPTANCEPAAADEITFVLMRTNENGSF